jgi:hypothetical protein
LNDIKEIVQELTQHASFKPEGYETADAGKMLGCSFNKLVSLRITRKLRTKKYRVHCITAGTTLKDCWRRVFKLKIEARPIARASI